MDGHALLELLTSVYSYGIILLSSIFAACCISVTFRQSQALGGAPSLQNATIHATLNRSGIYLQTMKRVFAGLSFLVLASSFTEGCLAIGVTLKDPATQERLLLVLIHRLTVSIFYATVLVVPIYKNTYPTMTQLSSWLLAVAVEIATSETFPSTKMVFLTDADPSTEKRTYSTRLIRFVAKVLPLEVTRVLTLCLLVILYAALYFSRFNHRDTGCLVCQAQSRGFIVKAACTNGHERSEPVRRANNEELSQKNQDAKQTLSDNWQKCFRSYRALLPYIWPSKSRYLQLVAYVCFALLGLQRIVNILIPCQTETMFAKLLDVSNNSSQDILRYIIYIWLQDEKGLLKSLHSILWDRVRRHCSRQISIATFEHVHNLSLDFHLGKQNEDLLSAMRDREAITAFLELVTFRIIPTLVDFGIAMGCFWILFDGFTSLMLGTLILGYVSLTAPLTKGERKVQRQIMVAYREESSIKNASLKLYEVVKYYNAEEYEAKRYYNALEKRQDAESAYLRHRHLSETYQLAFFMASFLAICLMTARRVSEGHLSVGQFMSLTTYLLQLRNSLNFAAGVSQSVQTFLVNSENTLELLRQQPTVMDSPQAIPLTTCRGDIRLENATFSYGGEENAVNGVSFNCPAGSTTALVGESGQGKSTIFRLLFRFYNLQDGCIFIDGQNVQDISIDSLRRQIGVVPQDTVLFNETVMYNLKYANQEATDEDVYEACRAARIHDIILGFPDGYATWVGERGLCLSGGERQRVAIARTILKKAKIILLDEATASLDTNTEEHVQNSLAILGRDRTILVIAHRLSTIKGADSILVFHDGQVVERGTHQELIKLRGRYASMWWKQVSEQHESGSNGRQAMENQGPNVAPSIGTQVQ